MPKFLLARDFRRSEMSVLFQQYRLLSSSQSLAEFSDISQSDLQHFPSRMSHESVLALQFGPTGFKFTLTQKVSLKKPNKETNKKAKKKKKKAV